MVDANQPQGRSPITEVALVVSLKNNAMNSSVMSSRPYRLRSGQAPRRDRAPLAPRRQNPSHKTRVPLELFRTYRGSGDAPRRWGAIPRLRSR
jgi:hypothetical protein